ncbi:hypothetical protein BH10BAC3_BH10BAC3_22180 [soil metagenome]
MEMQEKEAFGSKFEEDTMREYPQNADIASQFGFNADLSIVVEISPSVLLKDTRMLRNNVCGGVRCKDTHCLHWSRALVCCHYYYFRIIRCMRAGGIIVQVAASAY